MSIVFPPPLSEPPPPQSFWQDFKLLLGTQLRVTWNKLRHWPFLAWLGVITASLGLLSVLAYLGFLAYGALRLCRRKRAGFLSLVFLLGIARRFSWCYFSLCHFIYVGGFRAFFVSPVPLRVVFAVKSLVIAQQSFDGPLILLYTRCFYGLLFQPAPRIYWCCWWAVVSDYRHGG